MKNRVSITITEEQVADIVADVAALRTKSKRGLNHRGKSLAGSQHSSHSVAAYDCYE